MRGLLAAFALFTAIPAPVPELDRRTVTGAVRALPVVGVILGFGAGLVGALLLWLGVHPSLAGVVVLALLALATGGFHLDGVADVADGLGSRAPREKALEIMKRSDIGPMGVIAMVFVLLLGGASLVSLAATIPVDGVVGALQWASVVALGPALGRYTVVLSTTPATPSARPGGFGSMVTGVSGRGSMLGWGAVLAVAAAGVGFWAHGVAGLVAILVSALVAMAWAQVWLTRLRKWLGGLTGDCYGSLIETTCAAYWLAAAVAAAVAIGGGV